MVAVASPSLPVALFLSGDAPASQAKADGNAPGKWTATRITPVDAKLPFLQLASSDGKTFFEIDVYKYDVDGVTLIPRTVAEILGIVDALTKGRAP